MDDLSELYDWYLSAHNSPLRVFSFDVPFFGLLCSRQDVRCVKWTRNPYRSLYRSNNRRPVRSFYPGPVPLRNIHTSLVLIYRLYCYSMKRREPTLQDFLDFLAQVCCLYFNSTKVDAIVRCLTRRQVLRLFSCVGVLLQMRAPGRLRYTTPRGSGIMCCLDVMLQNF